MPAEHSLSTLYLQEQHEGVDDLRDFLMLPALPRLLTDCVTCLRCKGRNGVLFLDDCAAYPKDTSFLRNLRVVFLPANTTSHLQPLDAGIINNVKHFYRKCIVRRFLACVSHGDDPRKLSLLDAMHYLSTSWDSVTSEMVSNCFRKCGFRQQLASEDTECSEDDPVARASDIDDDIDEEFLSTGADAPFAKFVSIDDNVPTCEPQSVAEIVAEVVGGDAAKEVGDKAPEDSGENESVR
ncbi:hypothetical protein HPB52_023846 [Rhipicephalus sanguineus]|uniref:DDE-1 domain-containing protein n=1 Tax=Rhipicephalus sanguineus TaxID=34632 RepID=A0A9D4PSX2_RHISA|nr:hypothetical protein HPB52_023846 [Rhipicephalus sanguineus]